MVPHTKLPAATRLLRVVAVGLVGLVVAGCGRPASPASPGNGGAGDRGAVSSASVSPTGTAPTGTASTKSAPPRSSAPADPAPPPPSAGVLTLDGVARRGVEPGCTVLDTGDRLYLLLGGGGHTPDQAAIPLGVPLRVHAIRVDQLVSYCQQGVPVEIVDLARR